MRNIPYRYASGLRSVARIAVVLAFLICLLAGAHAANAGGTVTITVSGGASAIGNVSGTNYAQAQSFQISAGYLSNFSFVLSSNTGSPSGGITWTIHQDNGGLPGDVLAIGTVATPIASSVNTVILADMSRPFFQSSTLYWLSLKPSVTQSTNVYWIWVAGSNPSPAYYASVSTNAGSSWTITTYGLQSSFTTLGDATPTPSLTPTPVPTPTLAEIQTAFIDAFSPWRVSVVAAFLLFLAALLAVSLTKWGKR